MSKVRKIRSIFSGKPTYEGAGVKLKRLFGYNEIPIFDPFLLLDDFGSTNPEEYIAGFPWHPHRGIETVTYMIHGIVSHSDSLGNKGDIEGGQVQWMTAGSGIIHQEMPQKQDDFLRGLQLWVNLPSKYKMISPRYQDIKDSDIFPVKEKNGVQVKVIAGLYKGTRGPVKEIICDPQYLDVWIPPQKVFNLSQEKENTVFIYVINGEGYFDITQKEFLEGQLGLFGKGEEVQVTSGKHGVRFILISGKPIGEPITWRGPIVMNSEEELDQAFEEYRNGSFIK
ncbi:MAG: pirin family protein [Actinobacteria bacterium]|nr:pirin family protein [Actinomycetota bacterium]